MLRVCIRNSEFSKESDFGDFFLYDLGLILYSYVYYTRAFSRKSAKPVYVKFTSDIINAVDSYVSDSVPWIQQNEPFRFGPGAASLTEQRRNHL